MSFTPVEVVPPAVHPVPEIPPEAIARKYYIEGLPQGDTGGLVRAMVG